MFVGLRPGALAPSQQPATAKNDHRVRAGEADGPGTI